MYLLGLAIHNVQNALYSVRLALGVGVAGAQKQFLCGLLFLSKHYPKGKKDQPSKLDTRLMAHKKSCGAPGWLSH